MHPIVKLIIGAIMIIGSVAAVFYSTGPNNLLDSFKTVVKGILPAAVFLLGIFIVWLELDELKIERELKKESRKRK